MQFLFRGGGGGNFFLSAKFYFKGGVFVRSCNQFQDRALSGATVASNPDVRKAARKKKCLFVIARRHYRIM